MFVTYMHCKFLNKRRHYGNMTSYFNDNNNDNNIDNNTDLNFYFYYRSLKIRYQFNLKFNARMNFTKSFLIKRGFLLIILII